MIAFAARLPVGMFAFSSNDAADLKDENASLIRENELLHKLNAELLEEREEVRAVLESGDK